MFIKDANMMLESFVVIRSIRTCKSCSTGILKENINALSNDKTRASTWVFLEQNLQKEVDQITPFLKFGSAAKEAKLAFAGPIT